MEPEKIKERARIVEILYPQDNQGEIVNIFKDLAAIPELKKKINLKNFGSIFIGQNQAERYIQAGIEEQTDCLEAKKLAQKYSKEQLERAQRKFKSSIPKNPGNNRRLYILESAITIAEKFATESIEKLNSNWN